MRVISLASGSSGNALLVEAGTTRVLVDAGLQPRLLVARLRQAGVDPATLAAILLTHEHGDHACGAVALAVAHGVPLVTDPRTLRTLAPGSLGGAAPPRQELPVGRETRLGALAVRSFPLSHDAAAPCGFVLSSGAWSVCVAVDTGEVTPAMAEALRAAPLLVVEANHDEMRLQTGPYPRHLKLRIRGARGHLSNEQTAQALAAALDDGPRWVWLAHLSRTNNTPDLARATVRGHLRRVGLGHVRVEAAPPGLGPTWDSATLWTAPVPAPADVLPGGIAPPAADVRARQPVASHPTSARSGGAP